MRDSKKRPREHTGNRMVTMLGWGECRAKHRHVQQINRKACRPRRPSHASGSQANAHRLTNQAGAVHIGRTQETVHVLTIMGASE
jgi:hypothetical protein